MTSPDISALMEQVVSDLSDAIGYTVHFHKGHMVEITDIVKQISDDPDINKRYPLIALRHDVKQKEKSQITEMDFTLYIVTLSNPSYIAQERIDNIFEPYLRPIRQELIRQMSGSGYFDHTEDELKEVITFYERLFWGKAQVMGNDANIFGDWVDCIELEFSGLKVFNSCETPSMPPRMLSAIAADANNIYLTWDTEMADPSDNKSQILISFGFTTDVPDSVTLSTGSRSMKLYFNFDEIEEGNTVTISAIAGTFESESGSQSINYINYPVTNMV